MTRQPSEDKPGSVQFQGAPVNPPTTFGKALLRIGPGLIIAGSIVGSGELIATTKVGAESGFWLLWLIIIGCVIKVFPAENWLLWNLLTSGNYEEAVKVYRWYTPLLHLDTHPKLVQYIKLAVQECGLGSETVRAPRLALVGEEREGILGIIRQAIQTRPK